MPHPKPFPTCIAALCAFALSPLFAGEVPEGAGYRIRSSSVDGGTPQASSHVPSGYRLAGSIGQPDAATSTAGTITLQGGFWPAPAKDTSAAIFANGFE